MDYLLKIMKKNARSNKITELKNAKLILEYICFFFLLEVGFEPTAFGA